MVCQLSAEAIGGTKEMWYVVFCDTGEQELSDTTYSTRAF